MATEDFKLLQKIEDMIAYAYPILSRFPKAEKFSLAQDIRFSMNSLLKLTITEEKKYSKRTTLENMDIENETLKHYVRLANKLQFLSNHSYGVWEAKIVEIGKMIGGLLKSVNVRPKS